MNGNLFKHRLLGILHRRYDLVMRRKYDSTFMSFEELKSELKCSDSTLRMIMAELLVSEEIGCNSDNSAHIMDLGIASLSNKKYQRIYWTNIKDSVKYWFQILVPVLSLLVALFAVTHDFKKHDEETGIRLREMKSQIELLQSQIEQLKFHQNDSLKTK